MNTRISAARAALVAAGVAAAACLATPGLSARSHSSATRVTVVATEFKFKLTPAVVASPGSVTFTVLNKGKISHDFKIGGKKTANLLPGKSVKLTVKFTKKGHYAYLCTLPGHAGAGMKGTFSVGVKAVTTTQQTTTQQTTTQQTTTTTNTNPVGTAKTTVTVNMVEYAFQLSQSTMPSGKITFIINNKGNEVHNFAILGNRAGAQIAPGTSETWTVSLPPGTYNYQCDVPFHAANGMVGQFTVTP